MHLLASLHVAVSSNLQLLTQVCYHLEQTLTQHATVTRTPIDRKPSLQARSTTRTYELLPATKTDKMRSTRNTWLQKMPFQ